CRPRWYGCRCYRRSPVEVSLCLGFDLPEEVHEVATEGFDVVVGQLRVADPKDQGLGRGRASGPVASSAWANKVSSLSGTGAAPSRGSSPTVWNPLVRNPGAVTRG